MSQGVWQFQRSVHGRVEKVEWVRTSQGEDIMSTDRVVVVLSEEGEKKRVKMGLFHQNPTLFQQGPAKWAAQHKKPNNPARKSRI